MVNLYYLSKLQTQNNYIKNTVLSFSNMTFYLGQLVVVGSRPGMGRTTFLLYMLQTFIEQSNGNMLFITNEHNESEVYKRFASQVSSIERSSIDFVLEDVIITHDKMLTNSNVNIQASRGFWEDQREFILTAIKKQQIKVLFIDILQGLHSKKSHINLDQEISYIVEDLKKVTVDNQILTIISSNICVGDEYTGYRPRLSGLRDSGTIESESDVVIMIHRPEYYEITEDEDGNSLRGIAEIFVVKNRNGDLGESFCRFKRNVPQFVPFNILDR